ncbi:alpha/beta hydrolase [Halioxenophilus sp. WMMB6]|uniref:alpha/beta fold hydrolase n=1 Tax=Halioxenophilus sp. WMMB6 TaxID=3073815 RepID=UPI00295F4337|nr:alpha/beta hydrolase [Halioxenophilus sp. WMMB6]
MTASNQTRADGSLPYQIPADAPEWFVENLNQPGESHRLAVAWGEVHFLAWNWQREELPVLLLVHGFAGHARWWSYLAPFFADRYRVASIDLPGMGDSDGPAQYSDDCFALGIVRIIEAYQLKNVTLIGHSFGGAQTMRSLAMQPDYIAHGIIVDTVVRFPPENEIRLIEPRTSHKLRPNQAACINDFRLMPDQPAAIPALLHHIAYHSCEGDEHGWHWKFDPRLQNYGEILDVAPLQSITAKVDLIYGECSLFATDNRPQKILQLFPNHGRLIMVPEAYHHLMLDHPLPLVDAINALLA